MIIVGYPGIGKSTLAGRESGCIDLDSSDFRHVWPCDKSNSWYVGYCKMAEVLSKQGFTVFVSSHEAVRNVLIARQVEDFALIFPSLELKDKWLKRLRTRAKKEDAEPKHVMAYERAVKYYEDDIGEMQRDRRQFDGYTITKMDYDLLKIADMLERRCKRRQVEKQVHSGCDHDSCPIVFD